MPAPDRPKPDRTKNDRPKNDGPTGGRPAPDPDDPKGLIRESFRIDGISDAECRSILIDWALSLPADRDARAAMARLSRRYGEAGAHPMTRLMQEAVADPPAQSGRRGGRAGRLGRKA